MTVTSASNNSLKDVKEYFSNKVVSHQAVVNYFCELRGVSQKDLLKKNK